MSKTNKPETKTFYLTRDVDFEPEYICLWDEKPTCDPRGNYLIEQMPEDDVVRLNRSCPTIHEWEQSFDVRFKRGTQIKVTLEITEAETAVDKARRALESNSTTKAELIAILKDLIDGESENSRDEEEDSLKT